MQHLRSNVKGGAHTRFHDLLIFFYMHAREPYVVVFRAQISVEEECRGKERREEVRNGETRDEMRQDEKRRDETRRDEKMRRREDEKTRRD